MEFRNLYADEIEVRVSEISRNNSGLTLLLYKNARADMSILDEQVGPMNWQREHYQCGSTMFCRVGIRDGETGEWVWKSDAGKPSNYEAQKGEASDSFKRACTNWGLGRELYTAPRIWVPAQRVNLKRNNNGKIACYDMFEVAKIVIEAHRIKALAIRDDTTGGVVYTWQDPAWRQARETTSRAAAPSMQVLDERSI